MAKYYCDNLIRHWRRDYFEADSDEEAIQLAENGTYDVTNVEHLDECDEYVRNNNGTSYIYELFNIKGDCIKTRLDEQND